MLAVLDHLAGVAFEFTAIAPPVGRLADALAERGIRHIAFSVRDEIGSRLPRDTICQLLKEALADATVDLVHANSLSMGRLSGAVAHTIGLPCVAHLRDILKLSRNAISDLNRNDLLIAVSNATRTYHVGQGIDANRTRVLFNGVDCHQFRPRHSTGSLKRELNLPDHSFLAATIGQIGLRKGQDVLAEAAIDAASRLEDIHFVLVGERHSSKAESIAFENSIVHQFQQAGHSSRLHRLGYRNDIAEIMNEIDLLIHPAHQEPLGRVLLEAAASGVPIVATRVGGTAEILEDGSSARLLPPQNSQALVDAIIELHGDPHLRSRLAREARARIETRFPIEHAARSLSHVWTELTG